MPAVTPEWTPPVPGTPNTLVPAPGVPSPGNPPPVTPTLPPPAPGTPPTNVPVVPPPPDQPALYARVDASNVAAHAAEWREVLAFPAPSTAAPRTDLTPHEMTWRRVSTQRPWSLIDEKHIYYQSQFHTGTLGDFPGLLDGVSPQLNPNITIDGINASVADSCFVATSVHPRMPWVSIQMRIESMTDGSGVTALGPAAYKDDDNFISAQFDVHNGTIRLTEMKNGISTVVVGEPEEVPQFPFTLTLKITGHTASAWIGDRVAAVMDTLISKLKTPSVWDGYRVGLWCDNQSDGGPHTFSSLRAGGAGVLGFENLNVATHADGATYFIGNRVVMTADASGMGTLTEWRNTIWLVDLDTGAMEMIGSIFFTQKWNGNNVRLAGGTYTNLMWIPDKGKWLVTVIPGDLEDYGQSFDYYGFVDLDLFAENLIDHTQMSPFVAPGSGPYSFGCNPRLFNGKWYVGCIYDATGNPDYSGERAAMLTGDSLDDLDLLWVDTADRKSEGPQWMRVNGVDYFFVPNTYGVTVYNYLTGEDLGDLYGVLRGDNYPSPFPYPGTIAEEMNLAHVSRPYKGSGTEFFGISSNHELFNVHLVQDGETVDFGPSSPWNLNRGGLCVWKAQQTTRGLEYNKYRNERLVERASIFVSATRNSKFNGLRMACPLFADRYDASDFSYHLEPVGVVTYNPGNGALVTGKGFYLQEPKFNTAGNWTASVTAIGNGGLFDATILQLGLRVELAIHSGSVWLTVYNGSEYQNLIAGVIPNPTASHTYLVRKIGETLSVWIDGVKAVEQTVTGLDVTSAPLFVGCVYNSADLTWSSRPTATNSFVGWISKVKYWSRDLTDAECLSDYNSGTVWMP